MITAMALFLSGCPSFTSTDSFCLKAEPIPNSNSCPSIVRGKINEHNAIGVDQCEW